MIEDHYNPINIFADLWYYQVRLGLVHSGIRIGAGLLHQRQTQGIEDDGKVGLELDDILQKYVGECVKLSRTHVDALMLSVILKTSLPSDDLHFIQMIEPVCQ